jgi:anthranilate phosphoribosyltransferase
VRRALGVRTIMNLLGPLSNPARPPVQLTGVYDPELVVPVATTLGLLGCESALVVHGGGLDEIALHAPTEAALLRGGSVVRLQIHPGAAGVREASVDALAGGAPEDNAALLAAALRGRAPEAHLAAIALNAGALLWIAGVAADLVGGVDLAKRVLASGRAHDRLEQYVAATRRVDPLEGERAASPSAGANEQEVAHAGA